MEAQVNINLFPWREQAGRQAVWYLTMAMCLGIFVTLLCIGIHMTYVRHEILKHQKKQAFYANKLMAIDGPLTQVKQLYGEKEAMLKKIHHMQEQKNMQNKTIDILGCVSGEMPMGMYLNHISAKQEALTIQGKALNTEKVEKYQENLEAHCNVSQVDIQLVSRDQDHRVYKKNFTLQLRREGI